MADKVCVVVCVAGSGDELISLSLAPETSVAEIRRAAAAAAASKQLPSAGTAQSIQILNGDVILDDAASLVSIGVQAKMEVRVVFGDAFRNWSTAKFCWREVELPMPTHYLGPTVRNVGRDRVLVFPALWQWESYCSTAADIWLVGADESSAARSPASVDDRPDTNVPCHRGIIDCGASFIGVHQVPLPLPDGTPVHFGAFADGVFVALTDVVEAEAEDKSEAENQDVAEMGKGKGKGKSGSKGGEAQSDEGDEGDSDGGKGKGKGKGGNRNRTGTLHRFRLRNGDTDDLGDAHFVVDGEPRQVRASFEPGDVCGFREFAEEHGIIGCEVSGLGQDRKKFGDLTLEYDFEERLDVHDFGEGAYALSFTMKNTSLKADVASFKMNGHPNVPIHAVGAEMALLSGAHAGEDASYENMRLVEWRSGEVQNIVPLAFGPEYIETSWPRGMLVGTSQSFYTAYSRSTGDHCNSCLVAFCTPCG